MPLPLSRRSSSLARRRKLSLEVMEDRWLMAADPLMPTPTTKDLSKVFFIGDKDTPAPPVKTITLTNNTAQTIYPILRDANTGKIDGIFYDPKDPHNQEFRGYVGYTQNGVNYIGLPANTTIQINVPLVFWDGANVYIATDGRDIIPATSTAPNPFEYDPASVRVVEDAPSAGSGLVMWYTVPGKLANTPTPDAPAQLTEFTIRDEYLKRFGVPDSQTIKLINYDVSYVDSNLLSVAMEATQVPVPNTDVKADYGWIGATLDQATLQKEVANFVQNAGNELGTYFDGKGWPSYYNPAPSPGGIKIPSGANIFANSPLNDTRSKYDNLLWALSSGGAGPLQTSASGIVLNAQTPNVITVNFPDTATRDAFFTVLANGQANKQDFLVRTVEDRNDVLGKVTGFAKDPVNDKSGTVTIDRSTGLPINSPRGFEFFRPVTDYASTRIRDIWYAWADYYVKTFTSGTKQLKGSLVSTSSNAIKLSGANASQVVALGMGVQGNKSGIRPGTTVLAFDKKDPSIVYLSQLPASTGDDTFTFSPPTPMPYASEANPLNLTFAPGQATADARLFAASVYEAMAAEAAIPIPLPGDAPPKLPKSMVLVSTTIGADILHLPNSNDPLGGQVRDLIKSILRGVFDFTQVPDTKWYPDPSLGTGGLSYNAYNLDPYVWFVHQKLGLSGYGFSVDDDTADVGANGTDTLTYVVSTKTGLPNPNEWFPSVPYGQITAMAQIIPGQGGKPDILQLLDPVAYQQIRPDDPANSVTGAFVTGAGIPAGTNLANFGLLNQLQFILSTSKAKGTNGQYAALTFSGKSTPTLGLAPTPVTTQLLSAANRFASRVEAATNVKGLPKFEDSFASTIQAATTSALKSKTLTPTVRRELRRIGQLTANMHLRFRELVDGRLPLARFKKLVDGYELALAKRTAARKS